MIPPRLRGWLTTGPGSLAWRVPLIFLLALLYLVLALLAELVLAPKWIRRTRPAKRIRVPWSPCLAVAAGVFPTSMLLVDRALGPPSFARAQHPAQQVIAALGAPQSAEPPACEAC